MAGRYANALFELALEQHALDAVQTDLEENLVDQLFGRRFLVQVQKSVRPIPLQ